MALSLSADKLKYSEDQLAGLSTKIKEGDLTTVLKIYEEDIKNPLRNALVGSLVRSLLIQIQKTKARLNTEHQLQRRLTWVLTG
jgi:nuclear control of ATPase protein 2